ncbi:DUF1616 domain-containing protein [Candidatus Micrarchaeota archaeon]|nr:DUF1616 domain-containing protein [Candidatus Micrarchaeota archaeon]
MKLKDKVIALAFISAIIASIVLVTAEVTEPSQSFDQLTAFWRIPLGLYLILFPTGFLFYSFLFPYKKTVIDIEGFGLSIALSISTISLSILIANMLLRFPITLEHNLIIITALNVIFYALFIFREKIVPHLTSFWVNYCSSLKPRFSWSKFIDIVFFSNIIVFLLLLADVIVKYGEEFDQILSFLSIPLLAFFILFPTGYLIVSLLFSRKKELYSTKLLLLTISLSVASFFISLVLVFISSFLIPFQFSLIIVLALLMLFNILIYILFLFVERIIPLIYFVFFRREK